MPSAAPPGPPPERSAAGRLARQGCQVGLELAGTPALAAACREPAWRPALHQACQPGYLDAVAHRLRRLMQQQGLACRIQGRLKHPASVCEKAHRLGVPPAQLHDLIGLRVILRTSAQCYQALRAVHALWRPVPERFKDYVRRPKANSYRSLHTTVVGPWGQLIEVQLRSERMHEVAEEGEAAHWRYKQAVAPQGP